MMYFQTVKAAIQTLLISQATAGRFTVRTYQQAKREAETIKEYNRQATVFYKSGNFAPGSRPGSGVTQHDMTFQVEMAVAAASSVDLRTLDDPESTNQQRQSALGAFLDAGQHADNLMDDFWNVLWNILQDPLNGDLGLPPGSVADIPGSVRVNDFEKSDVGRDGQYAALVGTFTFKVRCTEKPAGDQTNQPLNTIESDIQPSSDIQTGVLDPSKANVETQNLQGVPS